MKIIITGDRRVWLKWNSMMNCSLCILRSFMAVHLDVRSVGPDDEWLSYHCMLACDSVLPWAQSCYCQLLQVIADFFTWSPQWLNYCPIFCCHPHTLSLLLISVPLPHKQFFALLHFFSVAFPTFLVSVWTLILIRKTFRPIGALLSFLTVKHQWQCIASR